MEFSNLILVLRNAYPQKEINFDDKDVMILWYKMLGGLDLESMALAVADIVRENEFFPAIAEIRKRSLLISRNKKEREDSQEFQADYKSMFQTKEKQDRFRHNIGLCMAVAGGAMTKEEATLKLKLSGGYRNV